MLIFKKNELKRLIKKNTSSLTRQIEKIDSRVVIDNHFNNPIEVSQVLHSSNILYILIEKESLFNEPLIVESDRQNKKSYDVLYKVASQEDQQLSEDREDSEGGELNPENDSNRIDNE